MNEVKIDEKKVIEREWGEITSIEVSQALPVIWLGEDTLTIKRIARVVRVKYLGEDKKENEIVTILNVGRVDKEIQPVKDGIYIVAGGVEPKIIRYIASLTVNRKALIVQQSNIKECNLIVPSGTKLITSAVLGEEVEFIEHQSIFTPTPVDDLDGARLRVYYPVPRMFKIKNRKLIEFLIT